MSPARIRDASCACGGIGIRLTGEPEYVSSCACQQCQRRTGSAFGVTAFFSVDQVAQTRGEPAVFQRVGESGHPLLFRFCPDCGSTVWWEAVARPGRVCVAAGAFADPDFPAPKRLIWAEHKAAWVVPPEGAPEFPRGPVRSF